MGIKVTIADEDAATITRETLLDALEFTGDKKTRKALLRAVRYFSNKAEWDDLEEVLGKEWIRWDKGW